MAFETNTSKIRRRLSREGWELARHGGNHDIFAHPDRPGVLIPVPHHRSVSPLVARSIAKAAGWT
jgi:predicted RNA binding protein YcfA (HicA-like mRNA interferase family)